MFAQGGDALTPRDLGVAQTKLEHFWMTNAITRASPTMAKCVQAARNYERHPHRDPMNASAFN